MMVLQLSKKLKGHGTFGRKRVKVVVVGVVGSLIQNLTVLTFGQYIKWFPQKSLTFYFQGVWRGDILVLFVVGLL